MRDLIYRILADLYPDRKGGEVTQTKRKWYFLIKQMPSTRLQNLITVISWRRKIDSKTLDKLPQNHLKEFLDGG